ncbi:MAG: Trm112 family protein [Gemmatimonadota bacterium]|nr:Trm112 family protein [Gemmatimonadota bacterium]MDH3367090.1 Trm112 family protein [Gemmatimonadota bacterium]MDH3477712.1 Trm112 family protein [Gemmatimonadota bacterium]MDH3569981.1 Trm112 family protein [Gemmatimonadota bacterium]MDH5549283.1 Trm112 family protein [Gemmatimonadota bacterium]
MHIELTEFLRCPEGHGPRDYCVLMPETIVERNVRAGLIACPTCQATYPIVDGVVDFRGAEDHGGGASVPDATALPAADDVRALLGVVGPGGYVVVLGSACRLVAALSKLLPGVHFVLVNPPTDVASSSPASSVLSRGQIPLAPSMARGVLIGRDHVQRPWLGESARVLLRGLRVVVLGEPEDIHGVKHLASGQGMWVGERS